MILFYVDGKTDTGACSEIIAYSSRYSVGLPVSGRGYRRLRACVHLTLSVDCSVWLTGGGCHPGPRDRLPIIFLGVNSPVLGDELMSWD